ncbi:MAG: AAA family ATPase [Actinomycetota bacterium]
MEEERATPAEGLPRDAFASLAQGHRDSVRRIRERNRQRRLRYVLYANLLILAYLLRRAFQQNPLSLGLPSLGPDAMIWLFPLAMVLLLTLALVVPILANGRSPAVRFSPEQLDMTFADVRGIDTVLEEVTRTLQIFLAYKTFREELGGNPRRGILFEGSPGTGKTHLAKAMAAEAHVPFFFVSAPQFQSMFYGMTAFKIRAFFRELKKAARKEGGAIGFIEEIDAIGMQRSGLESFAPTPLAGRSVSRMVSSNTGGVVNELLIQLQSFESPPFWTRIKNRALDVINLFLPADHQMKKSKLAYTNLLVIGATNRAESLDPALLRPGRFDRILHFDLPTRAGRRDLVDYFLLRRKHEPEMEKAELREELAAMTLGYTPAMLEHILDEALVWALRDGRKALNWQDVQRARLSEEIGIGQPVAYTERERNLIATHEAGHAVTAYLCATSRKLEVLSIIKRRSALGLLAHSDTEERYTKSKSELESTLKIMLGGLAAETIFFGESGTGPSSDLKAATSLVAQMVGSFGMGSSLVSFEAVENGMHASPNLVAKVLSSEESRSEVKNILDSNRREVVELLERNSDLVIALRDALLDREELLGDEIIDVLERQLQRRQAESH